MNLITSLQNSRVKYLVRLRDDRRQRYSDACTIVEGRYELELALESGLTPIEIFQCEEFTARRQKMVSDFPCTFVTRAIFEKISKRENPDGWLAIMPIPARTLSSVRVSEKPFIVLAEAVEKPGNLGAMLRTADAAGADGFVVCDPRLDLYNPNVIRASRGTLFTNQVVEATRENALAWIRKRDIKILAATPKGDINYSMIDLREPICIAMGTEDEGLSDFWLENADYKIKIPLMGKVNSLNVSTATAIIAYEVVRQRNK